MDRRGFLKAAAAMPLVGVAAVTPAKLKAKVLMRKDIERMQQVFDDVSDEQKIVRLLEDKKGACILESGITVKAYVRPDMLNAVMLYASKEVRGKTYDSAMIVDPHLQDDKQYAKWYLKNTRRAFKRIKT